MIAQAARRQQVAIDRISFVDAARWLTLARDEEALPRLVMHPHRSYRYEPRVHKRRPEQYPVMHNTRQALPPSLGTLAGPPRRAWWPPSRMLPSGVGACSWVSGLITGRLLLPLRDLDEGDNLRRSLPMKPFLVTLRNELWERELPGLLPMVGEPAEFLRIQPSSRAIWICTSLR